MVTFYKRLKPHAMLRNQASLDFLDDYDTTDIFDERWLSKNRKGKLMPGMTWEEGPELNRSSGRESMKKPTGWKKFLRLKNHG